MDWPSLKVPHESSKITIPLGPVLCPDCKHVGIPEPVLTCLGDFVLRLGGWCKNCRRWCCLLDMTTELMIETPPSKFLTYDQLLPVGNDPYPRTRWSFFNTDAFPYGANTPKGVSNMDPHVTRAEAAAAHNEGMALLVQHGFQAAEVYAIWKKVGFMFGDEPPLRSQVVKFKTLVSETTAA